MTKVTAMVRRRGGQDRGRGTLFWWVNAFSLLALLPLMVIPLPVTAQGPAVVHLRPASAEIAVGESIIVEIVVSNVSDLYGMDVQFLFDPNILQVEDANPSEEGVQLQPGSFLYPDFLVRNTVDNVVGKAWFALNQLNPREPVSGEGTIALVQFVGQAPGTSSVHFVYHLLGTRDGEAIETIAEDGEIIVRAGATAPTQIPTDTPPPTIPSPTNTSPPTKAPTAAPTEVPTEAPTATPPPPQPTKKPTEIYPGPAVTEEPTAVPSRTPTRAEPTDTPTATSIATPQPVTFTPTVAEKATPTSPLPTATPTTRRITTVAVTTPTPSPEPAKTEGLISIVAYGLVVVVGIALLFWFRRGK